MFCGQCGKQVPDAAKFCAACGANLQGDASAGAQPKGGGSLKFAVAGVVVVAAGAAGYVLFSRAPVEKPAAVAPKPAVEAVAPEPKAPEKPPDPPAPAVAEPQRPDPAALEAAHKALDQRIADEEAAAKEGAAKK